MKTAGLIGGMSWESTALYYKLLNQQVRVRLGGLHSAKIIMESVDFHEIEVLQRENQWQEAGRLLADIALRLERGGADFVLLCTNTMHKVAPMIEDAITVPFLHLADATAEKVLARGEKKVGLLGTSFTMEEDFYCERLLRRGIEVITPDAAWRREINRIIFDELCCGEVHERSKQIYLQAIDTFAVQGAQSVIFGCTEIGLLVPVEQSSLPVIDTTRVHVDAALEYMLA